MAKLIVVQGELLEPEYPLEGRELILGRQPDVDVLLNAREVSRRHARIYHDGNSYLLEDLESSNGTFLNSTPLKGRIELHEQDQIGIGPYLFRFEIAPSGEGQVVIRTQATIHPTNTELFRQDPARKLQAI